MIMQIIMITLKQTKTMAAIVAGGYDGCNEMSNVKLHRNNAGQHGQATSPKSTVMHSLNVPLGNLLEL
jgi:alpha-acetolactate decarboxylase